MLETDIEKQGCSILADMGWLTPKIVSPSGSHWPDRLIIPYNRPMFLIEYKREGERPRRGQRILHKRITDRGHDVFVVDNIQDVYNIIGAVCK